MSEKRTRNCPTCQLEMAADSTLASRPFCSERCKMADLGKWLDGEYSISRPLTLEEALDLPVDDA